MHLHPINYTHVHILNFYPFIYSYIYTNLHALSMTQGEPKKFKYKKIYIDHEEYFDTVIKAEKIIDFKNFIS